MSVAVTEQLETPLDYIRWAASRFEALKLCYGHGTDTALDEARALVLQCLNLPHELPGEYLTTRLLSTEREAIVNWVNRRCDTREPLPYITGRAWFAGLPMICDARALVPRSPMAELILQGFEPWVVDSPRRVLDLCTGGGSIAIACAYVFTDAQVMGTDLSTDALALAAENRALHNLENRLTLSQGDLFGACPDQVFDLIVSNPPYVSAQEYAALPAEYAHEPRAALETGEEGLDLVRRMLNEAANFLSPGGMLICEVGATATAMMQRWPRLPLMWPEFESGGDGIFIISREDLLAAGELD